MSAGRWAGLSRCCFIVRLPTCLHSELFLSCFQTSLSGVLVPLSNSFEGNSVNIPGDQKKKKQNKKPLLQEHEFLKCKMWSFITGWYSFTILTSDNSYMTIVAHLEKNWMTEKRVQRCCDVSSQILLFGMCLLEKSHSESHKGNIQLFLLSLSFCPLLAISRPSWLFQLSQKQLSFLIHLLPFFFFLKNVLGTFFSLFLSPFSIILF